MASFTDVRARLADVRAGSIGLAVGQVAVVVAFVALWQWASDTGRVPRFFVGSPSKTFGELRQWSSDGSLWSDVWVTVEVLLIGFVLGVLIGFVLGVALGVSAFLRDVLHPFLVFLNGLPRLLLLPLLVIIFGFGLVPGVIFVVLIIFVPTTIYVHSAFVEIDRDLLANIELLGGRSMDVVRQVYVPFLAQWVLGNMRALAGFAFQGAVIAGFWGEAEGLGHKIVHGQATDNVNEIFAAILVVVIIAVLLDNLLVMAERYAGRWAKN